MGRAATSATSSAQLPPESVEPAAFELSTARSAPAAMNGSECQSERSAQRSAALQRCAIAASVALRVRGLRSVESTRSLLLRGARTGRAAIASEPRSMAVSAAQATCKVAAGLSCAAFSYRCCYRWRCVLRALCCHLAIVLLPFDEVNETQRASKPLHARSVTLGPLYGSAQRVIAFANGCSEPVPFASQSPHLRS